MAEERVQRKLAAIMAADVVGYSRLMGEDETGTLAALKELRAELIDPTIAEHQGRIVKLMGDGALVEFASVVDAVECAISIQRDMQRRNVDTPEARRIVFRIGVNLGDVIIEGDDIYGDGVNVAARLEGLAEPGGVCISGSAFEQVRDKLAVGFEDLGEQQVKNIDRPVQAYRVLTDPTAAGEVVVAPTIRTKHWKLPAVAAALVFIVTAGVISWWQPWVPPVDPLPLPENPSIAVLPFDNLSGDAFAEVLQRDITGNIGTTVSRLPGMFVITRRSNDRNRDTAEDVLRVAEELGVRYAVKGNVRLSGDEVRITAKLIDAQAGHNLWEESYDRELQNVSTLQDEVALNVVTALKVNLVEEAGARIVRGNTSNPEAYQLVRRGLSLFRGDTKKDNAEARRLFEKAVELDPNYTIGWHLLGYAHAASSRREWGNGRVQERTRAEELARKAMANNPSASGPYILLSTISRLAQRKDEPVVFAEKAVALAPNDAMNVAFLGQALVFSGRPGQPEEALPVLQRAIRLSPYAPPPVLFYEGLGYQSLSRYEEAIAAFDRARSRGPKGAFPLALLAIASADLGRIEEARAAARVLKEIPIFSAKAFVDALDYEDHAKSERAVATLLELGLPD
jgi:adenylate cyclase